MRIDWIFLFIFHSNVFLGVENIYISNTLDNDLHPSWDKAEKLCTRSYFN